jgi:hypothetical protein
LWNVVVDFSLAVSRAKRIRRVVWGNLLPMGVWQAVAMDSLKFYPSPPCPTLLHPAGGSGVACPQGGQTAAVFHPFGHPMPYAYASTRMETPGCTPLVRWIRSKGNENEVKCSSHHSISGHRYSITHLSRRVDMGGMGYRP